MNSVQDWLSTPAGRALGIVMAIVYTTMALSSGTAFAQPPKDSSPLGAEYRVGPGDHIYMSVPQRPDLNRQLAVSEGGTVNLPLVGNVAVRGLNKIEIEAKLLQSLREYYPSVTSVQISITQALSNVIFVSGEVRFPGKYSFPTDVNVWEAIREAGGPVPSANLSSVRVVTDRSRGGTSTLVDVQSSIETGSVEALPILKPGDTLIVPGAEELYTGSSGVNVTGAVIRPGNYRLTGRQDLMGAILMAGGPSDRANLSSVRLIRPDSAGRVAETYKVNVNRFLEDGKMESNPKLRAGDTIEVGKKTFTGRDVGLILSFVTALGTLVLLYYTIQNEASTSN
jgi:protein involved in polysaccharide export with SLBB domain